MSELIYTQGRVVYLIYYKPTIAIENANTISKNPLNAYFYNFLILLRCLKKSWFLLSKGVSDKLQLEDLDVVTGCERVIDLLVTIQAHRCEAKFDYCVKLL